MVDPQKSLRQSLRRLEIAFEEAFGRIPEGADRSEVLLRRGRQQLALFAQDLRGAPMRALHTLRLREELTSLLPWPAEDHERLLLEGFLPSYLGDPEREPLVSVIVPVYGKLDYTLRCLLSLGQSGAELPFEILVVDDCSPDRSGEVLSRCPGIRYLRNEVNGGFIRSCNRGAAEARGRYLCFLNNDTVALPGWLDALVRTHERVPGAGLVGSKLIYPSLALQEAGGVVWRDASATNLGNGRDPFNPRYNHLRDADYVSGASILIEKALFEELGAFDLRYAPAYYEDTDLAFKVRAAGRRVLYQPASRVIHYEGATSGRDIEAGIKRHQAINREVFRKKWAEVLSDHGGYGELGPEELDRFSGATVLVMDSRFPEPDQDSGSVDRVNQLKVLRSLGCRLIFLPVLPLPKALPGPNVMGWSGRYTEALEEMGVECPYFPYEPRVERFLRERGEELDLVLLSRVRIADRFLPDVRRHAPRAKVVFNSCDLSFLREEREAEHRGSRLLRWKSWDTRRRELRTIARSDQTILLSSYEQELVASLVPEARTRLIPLLREIPGRGAPFEDKRGVLFIGGYRHRPNVDAVHLLVEEIWPQVRRLLPGLTLHLAGSAMPREIERMAADDIRIHGFVPELADAFGPVRVSVAPLRYGAGVKGKVADSLGHGVPCVCTSMAVEGSGLKDGEEVLVADEPEAFARAIVRAHTEEALWEKLVDGGLAFVRERYALEAHRQHFLELFEELGIEPKG